MTKTVDEVVEEIHGALRDTNANKEHLQQELLQHIQSLRNSPEDNQLRELLVRIHQDSVIVQYLENNHGGLLYDPFHFDLDYERAGLVWSARNKRVVFFLVRREWSCIEGVHSVFYPFDSDGKTFFYNGKDLLDFFPKLTVEKLEECIKNYIAQH